MLLPLVIGLAARASSWLKGNGSLDGDGLGSSLAEDNNEPRNAMALELLLLLVLLGLGPDRD